MHATDHEANSNDDESTTKATPCFGTLASNLPVARGASALRRTSRTASVAPAGSPSCAQLADSTRRFLSDRRRNRYDAEEQVLRVSSIFDWYEEDFEDSAGGLGDYLLQYADALALPAEARRNREAGDLPVHFLDYDWSLNTASNDP